MDLNICNENCVFHFKGDFDAYEYVERLASTVVGGGSKGGADAFDPRTLSDVFEKTILELTALDEKMQGRINKLEELCAKEQEEHKQKARELETTYKVYFASNPLLKKKLIIIKQFNFSELS